MVIFKKRILCNYFKINVIHILNNVCTHLKMLIFSTVLTNNNSFSEVLVQNLQWIKEF